MGLKMLVNSVTFTILFAFQLQRLEEEARLKMREGIDQRREWALKRREVNIDRKKHLDGLRQTQGITEPWTYSYFIVWPRESYCRWVSYHATLLSDWWPMCKSQSRLTPV